MAANCSKLPKNLINFGSQSRLPQGLNQAGITNEINTSAWFDPGKHEFGNDHIDCNPFQRANDSERSI